MERVFGQTAGLRARVARGFTLIELLVVIAIVALLIGILLPALAQARDSARSVVELSRLRDLGFATASYAEANKGELPISSHSANYNFNWFANGFPWPQALYEFFGDAPFDPLQPPADSAWARVVNEHYRSPLDPSRNVEPGEHPATALTRFSFGQNVYADLGQGLELPGPMPGAGRPLIRPFRSLIRIGRPSQTVLQSSRTTESDTQRSDHHMAHEWKGGRESPGATVDAERHGSGAGFVMHDGHAEILRFEETFDLDREVDHWDPEGF